MLKRLFKEYKYLLLGILIAFILVYYKLPFKIEKTGGLINISKRIENYNINGSFNMAYVSEIDASILTYLYSLINPDWDATTNDKEHITEKENQKRGTIMLKNANQTAELVAYELANKEIKIKNTHYYVTYISDLSKTNLKIGDEIVEVDNIPIEKIADLNGVINSKQIGDILNITVLNDKKKVSKTAKIINYEGKKIGIMIIPIYEYNSKLNYKNNKDEYGPSGGLMMTLAIYDYITNSNLAKGRIIAGTGTIDIDGNIGEISGIKYKLKGALKDGADVFLVAKDNYKEAIKIKNDYNYDIEIVKVSNINEAIEYLKK